MKMTDMELREMARKHVTTHPVANHKDGWFYVWVTGLAIIVGSLFLLALLELVPAYNDDYGKYNNGPASKVETSYHESDIGSKIGIQMTEGYYDFLNKVCAETPEASGCN